MNITNRAMEEGERERDGWERRVAETERLYRERELDWAVGLGLTSIGAPCF